MNVSISSLTKHASRSSLKKSTYDVALTKFWEMADIDYDTKMAVAEILKDS